ncbi:MAG: hypothetical protein E7600_05500 [Ruminococcaceae bacterium]|nr:hypothetical protein [Oscillospiraceae bacterium]
MKYHTVIFQCFLCALLLAALLIIKSKVSNRAVEAGTFGKSVYNETLSDFCNNIYGDIFHE